MDDLTRRTFLRRGASLVGGIAGLSVLPSPSRAALAEVAPYNSRLEDIEHVVIFMQENRSFDHYFGSLNGVIGFDDPNVPRNPLTGRSAFEQCDPYLLDGAGGSLLPWHLGVKASAAACLTDLDHTWQTQHLSVHGGANDLFVSSHIAVDSVYSAGRLFGGNPDPLIVANGGARTMSYFTRADLPLHYALADGFTICDRYFCSVLGPTNPNRLYLMSATIDPAGKQGGPEVAVFGDGFSWTTYPERLQAAGIDWYVYRETDDFEDNMLDHFVAYQDESTELFRRGRSIIPDGQLPAVLRRDVERGNLPQVSWIVGPKHTTEHAEELPAAGAHYIAQILDALTADTNVWRKTLLILTYDENGGFFDHVPPPQAPPGTPGEYLTLEGLLKAPLATGIAGPIGLGPRVPTLLISPFTRGGYVCSDTFDHTSILQFLETRFGVEVPNITQWRRDTCGDLTSALNLGASPILSVPDLPDTQALWEEAVMQCGSLSAPQVPAQQVMPSQEPGSRPRPSGLVLPR
jgi:phospholipase C